MQFKDLKIGEWFEFDHSDLPWCHGLECGPWFKLSARKYGKHGKRGKRGERGERAMVCKVGSTSVEVILHKVTEPFV